MEVYRYKGKVPGVGVREMVFLMGSNERNLAVMQYHLKTLDVACASEDTRLRGNDNTDLFNCRCTIGVDEL
jgi:hypothetical protein